MQIRIDLPFFAYGIFKPGQLAFRGIADLVESVEVNTSVQGLLYEKEGVPLLEVGQGGVVKGALLKFKPDPKNEALTKIQNIEPTALYRLSNILVETPSGAINANVMVGKHPRKGGYPLETEDWDGKQDPTFTTALDIVEEVLRQNEEFDWDLKSLFRLEMAYLLLWSAIERFSSFTFRSSPEDENTSTKATKIYRERAFCIALKDIVTDSDYVYRSDTSRTRFKLDPDNPKSSIDYYYQIRNNIAHRGKAASRDHLRLAKCIEDLTKIFREVIKAAFEESEGFKKKFENNELGQTRALQHP